MNQLSIPDFRECAMVLALANTPLSLLRGIIRATAMQKLRQWDSVRLLRSYDYLTARSERNEYSIGSAYAILVASLLRLREGERIAIDASRLLWGNTLRDHLERSTIPTNRLDLHVPTKQPDIKVQTSSGPIILGSDGRPFQR